MLTKGEEGSGWDLSLRIIPKAAGVDCSPDCTLGGKRNRGPPGKESGRKGGRRKERGETCAGARPPPGVCCQAATTPHTHGLQTPEDKDRKRSRCSQPGEEPPVGKRRGKHTTPSGGRGEGDRSPAPLLLWPFSSLRRALSTEVPIHRQVLPSVSRDLG